MSVQCENCMNLKLFNKRKNQYCCGAIKNICFINIKKQRMC
ncbi:Uncharacterised protein [Clostridium perfringens]|uniref:Uncharacterized protein n=1 Tax=Clostridium perfringens TaxID=1502 RepID=A0A2X2YA92_CLOPF|nr:hypothetical protein [Clostridium perfringens]SQB59843.1 Uncharacterised protein [Clostridium perfringens]